MLNEKDLIISSCTILTGILLLFSLFNYSIEEQIKLQDKKIQLKTWESLQSFKLLMNIVKDNEHLNDMNNIKNDSIQNSDYDLREHAQNVEQDIFQNVNEIKMDIVEIEEKNNKIQLMKNTFTSPHKYIPIIIYLLGVTVIVSLISSVISNYTIVKKFYNPLLIVSHISFMASWIVIFIFAVKLSELSY